LHRVVAVSGRESGRHGCCGPPAARAASRNREWRSASPLVMMPAQASRDFGARLPQKYCARGMKRRRNISALFAAFADFEQTDLKRQDPGGAGLGADPSRLGQDVETGHHVA
jgi:hypothetical protein